MLNRIVLIGRLVADPEMKHTSSGVAVSSFRIAVDRPFRTQGGEQETDFIDCVAWRNNAEFAANYLHKGRLIAVEGRLQVRSYQAQDGTKRRVSEVVCDNVRGLDRPRETGEGAGSYAAPRSAEPHPVEDIPGYSDPFEDQ